MRRFGLLAAVEAVRCAWCVTGRVAAWALVAARRDAGLAVRLLHAPLLDVVWTPVSMAALSSFLSTPGSRRVPLEALALRSARRVSEDRFDGEIAPVNENWGRGTANNWGRGPPRNWGRGNGPIRCMSMSRVNVTTGSSLPAGKNTG